MILAAEKLAPAAFTGRGAAILRLDQWRRDAQPVQASYVRSQDGGGIVIADLRCVIAVVSEKSIRLKGDGGVLVAVFDGAEFFDGPMTAIDVAADTKIEFDAVQINLSNGDRLLISTQPTSDPLFAADTRRLIAGDNVGG